jgi:ATP-dependent RNA helicase RhlE
MSFEDLGLCEDLLLAVRDKGYTVPSPIQEKAIPAILTGRDVLAAAQTGTGKTAGFTLPLLQMLSQNPPKEGTRPIRALVLTPTRELAAQVAESIEDYGKHMSLRSTVVFGGVNINPQKAKLRGGIDILVATPGRLLDLHNQNCLKLASIEVLILDEADRMLDMGFIHDIRRLLKFIPSDRQTLLFSATFSKEIIGLTKNLLKDPLSVEVAAQNCAAETVTQQVYRVIKTHKSSLLKHLILDGEWEQVLVFTRTKHGADRLCKRLTKDGILSSAIHGNKSQGARTRALAGFKDGSIRVLVATDIAARGLDIKQLPHVVNFELPNVAEDYVHRIGRTGRAGSDGHAISLVSDDETKLVRAIERLLGKRLDACPLPKGFEKPAAADLLDVDVRERSNDNNNRGGGRNHQRPRANVNAGGRSDRPNDNSRGRSTSTSSSVGASAGAGRSHDTRSTEGRPTSRPARTPKGVSTRMRNPLTDRVKQQ